MGVYSSRQPTLSVGDSIVVSAAWQNVGIATLPERTVWYRLQLNGRSIVFNTPDYAFNPNEAAQPGYLHSIPVWPNVFPSDKAGRYEFKLTVWLSKDLGETNLDNNELILYVDVKE